ncbi:hypothetical protein Psed_5817 [Pseudonocardia dioxanivorans CB1190]|uniref:Uncharacterized protein n=1 Tax=Pseudonocardia dioxanivorans (strain ATCC 55486 / DSM 44775 / JCM 13855 / CB1190) TaxID=675635 RepID=F4D1F4_PSEUX|nr:hypothetical protein Psed_5817 [Pseudonocardia dioxanivorans CB1190]
MSCASRGCRRQVEVAVVGGTVAFLVCGQCAAGAMRLGGVRLVVLHRLPQASAPRPRVLDG